MKETSPFEFRFHPQQHVFIPLISLPGRVNRCMLDGGPQPIYQVHLVINGDFRLIEFFEDELTEIKQPANERE